MLIRQIMKNCALHQIVSKTSGDSRGILTAIEGERDVPFAIARVYFIIDTPVDAVRGFHAHRALDQFAICICGSCTFEVDDGRQKESINLAGPENALYMGPMLWREMRDFSPDCVLLVLASAVYDEADYIRGYDAFLELTH